jgi:hypothetical protein
MSDTDIVQVISLPMEIMGFSLTILDVFLKGTNLKLEIQFQRFVKWSDKMWSKYNKPLAFLYAVCFLGSFVGIGFYEGTRFNFLSYLVFFANVIFIIIFGFLRQLFPERQLLALGLALTMAGIAGEIYQVSQIDF